MQLPQLCWLPLLTALLPPTPAQKISALTVSRAAATRRVPMSLAEQVALGERRRPPRGERQDDAPGCQGVPRVL